MRAIGKKGLVGALALACGFGASAIEVAGSLVVDLNMANVTGVAEGAYIGTWVNQATGADKVGDFVPVNDGKGGKFARVNGVAAVQFDGNADSSMWCADALPATVVGSDTWSAEVWIYNPSLTQSTETYFSWTYRGSANKCMEMRYGTDNGNAIEHHSNNIGWNGIPAANTWHHIAITRDASGNEVLYLDGRPRTTKGSYTALDLPTGGNFHICGVKNGSATGNFDGNMFFSGYLGMIRVHADGLTAAQVRANYEAERATFQDVWTAETGAWREAANWQGGRVPSQAAVIANGGTATIADTVSLAGLALDNGNLVVDGGALTLSSSGTAVLAYGSGTGSLTVKNGTYTGPSATSEGGSGGNAFTLAAGQSGAVANTAVVTLQKEFNLTSGGTGRLVLDDGAAMSVTGGWFRGARGSAATAELVVNGGTLTCGDWLLLATDGGSGSLTINGGAVTLTGSGLEFTYAGSNNAQYGKVYLNGGTLELKRFQNNNTAGTQAIYFNGGVLKARETNTNFLENKYDACVVQAGGAIFETPQNYAVDVKNAFTLDAESAGGAIVKRGTGRVNFGDGFSFAGPVKIEEGSCKFVKLANLNAVTQLTLGTDAVVMCTEAGGVQALVNKLPADAAATILITNENKADDIDLTGHPNVKLGYSSDFTYTGTITYDPAATPTYSFLQNQGVVNVTDELKDQSGLATKLQVKGLAGANYKLVLKKDNTFTGGLTVDTAMLQSDTAKGFGTTGPITLLNGAELVVNNSGIDVQALIDRITADSFGAIVFCNDSKKDANLSLVGHPGIYLGSYPAHNFEYTGTIAWDGNEAHFGGGHGVYNNTSGGFLYKPAAGLADKDGVPFKIVGALPGNFGLMGEHLFTGNVSLSNGATVFFKNNGAAYGATNLATDPRHFSFDNGNIRLGDTATAFPAAFGITVDAGGMMAHLWSNSTLTFAGDLHGTGPITITDNGRIVFGGAANDYTGAVTLKDSCQFQVGSDAGYSWNFATSLPTMASGNAKFILYIPAERAETFSASLGGGHLVKEGPGRLAVTARQSASDTRVSGGTLAVAADGLLAGDLTVDAGATFEIAGGATVTVGALNGSGTITAPEGTQAKLVFTGGTFSGTVASNVTLVKTGTGRAELVFAGAACAFEVREGTLAVQATSLARPVVAAGATLEVMTAERGLLGKYYSGVNNIDDWKNIIGSLDRMAALERDRTAEAEAYSTGMGDTFVAHDNNDRYPGGFGTKDYWIAIWRGRFWAETEGTYAFATASDDGSTVFIDGALVVSNIHDQGWSDGQLDSTRREIALTRGWHDVVVGFYDATGGNNIGVKVTRPDGSAAFLDNASLYPAEQKPAVIGDTSAIAGTLTLGAGVPELALAVAAGETRDFSTAFAVGAETGTLAKEGDGTLVYGVHGQTSPGSFRVAAGTLTLKEATNVGALEVAEGARVTVSAKRAPGYRGLAFGLYDSDDNTYNNFKTLSAFRDYFYATEPNWLGDSWTLGWGVLSSDATNESSASNTWRFPDRWTNADRFNNAMTGYIYLPYDGQYCFGARTDDGFVLYVDGELYHFYGGVSGKPDDHNSGWKTLAKGFHKFEFAWREQGGGQYVTVSMKAQKADGTTFDDFAAWTPVPQELLYPELAYVEGLSGAGTLDLGTGELWIDQQADSSFSGTVAGSAGGYLVKDGVAALTLGGDFTRADNNFAVAGGTLTLKLTADFASAGALVIEKGATLVVDAAAAATFAGELRGAGTLVVQGGATVTVARSQKFTGAVRTYNGRFLVASEGTSHAQGYRTTAALGSAVGVTAGGADLALAATPEDHTFDAKYFRFTVKRTYDNIIVQLSEFSLWDKDGVRQNLGLAQAASGTAATALEPGQFAMGADYGHSANEGPANLFDGNQGTKLCLGTTALDNENDQGKWRVITMRLADSAKPVASYSFRTANDTTPGRNPSYWTLEASLDGETWTTIDEKNDYRDTPKTTFTESYSFTHTETDKALNSYTFGDTVPVAVSGTGDALVNGAADLALAGGAATLTGLALQETADLDKWQLSQQARADSDALGANGFWMLYGENDKAGAAFLKDRVNVAQPWRVTFTFAARKNGSDDWADGIGFCIHNEADGAGFCDTGRLGGSLAGAVNTAHPTCATFWFNVYGKENCGWALGGEKYETDAGFLSSKENRFSKDGYDAELAWDGHQLVGRVWHQGTLLVTLAQEADLAALVGAGAENWDGKATLGFIGATGGAAAMMYIRNVRVYTTPAVAPAATARVDAGATAALTAFADETTLDTLALGAGSTLNLAANAGLKAANLDYAFAAAQLTADGVASVNLAANGTGAGTLFVGGLVADGGRVNVTGGRLAAVDGKITVTVPETAANGVTTLVSFPEGAWTGAAPTFTVVGDSPEATKYRTYRAHLKADRITVSNRSGALVYVR